MELNDLRPLNQEYSQEAQEQEALDQGSQSGVGQQWNNNNNSNTSIGSTNTPSGHLGQPVYNGVNGSIHVPSASYHINATGASTQNNPMPSTSQYVNPDEVIANPWISCWLRLPAMMSYICVTLLIQGTLIGLIVLSITEHGIANVSSSQNDRAVFSFDVGLSMSWTFVPAVLFQAYGLVYAAVVKAACTRQPFVELLKNGDDGAAPEKSILLDYSSWIPPVTIYKAFKFGHNMLGWAQFVLLFAQLLLGPIASHLFDSKTTFNTEAVAVVQDTAFDDNAFDIIRGMSSALDFASASKLYDAPLLPWTTNESSLLSVHPPSSLPQTQEANVSVSTQSYGLHLECRILQPPAYQLVYDSSLRGWYFSATDRNCKYGGDEGVLFTTEPSLSYSTFAQTYRASCNADAGTSRIIVLAALKDDVSARTFSNVSVVSCVPSYQNNTGIASLTYTGANNMVLRSYNLTQQATLDNPLFASNFESQVCQTIVTNIKDEQATKLGDYILSYARKRDPQAYLSNDEVFVNATNSILQSAFNVMVQTFLIQPSAVQELQGTISRPQGRLIVVLPVAYTILGILLAVDLALLWACHYTYRYKEAQFEESTGLLGAAILLHGSDLDVEIGGRKTTTTDGKIGEDVSYDLRHGHQLGWKIEHWPYPRKTRLVATQKARPVKWFRA